jgi:LysM repeat protein
LITAELYDVGAGVALVDGVTYYVLDVGTSTVESAISSSSTTGTPTASLVINTPLEDGTVYHQVLANEALWSIALNYNTTIEKLKLLNGLSTDEIFEGQKILIRKPEMTTSTPTISATATFGIPTSTATHPVILTLTSTATPLPVSPTTRESGGMAVGIIILVALIAAAVGSWLGSKKTT